MTSAGSDAPDDAPDGDPAARAPGGTKIDGVDVLGALSPSRAADFKSCPLAYRFRMIDRLPEETSLDAIRGVVVHRVLEVLFELPAAERTPEAARTLVEPAWAHVRDAEPRAAGVLPDDDRMTADFLDGCRRLVERYFALEDPRALEPAEREAYVETLLPNRLLLRGVIDRLDVNGYGAVRVNDYKCGAAPAAGFEASALFQLRFYALVLWRSRGAIPTALRLLYLASSETITYSPDEDDLRATERLVSALWAAIREAERTGDWQPRRGWRCGWCGFKELCPAWGGTPPPLPDRPPAAEAASPGPPG